jgi:hypothetical protein
LNQQQNKEGSLIKKGDSFNYEGGRDHEVGGRKVVNYERGKKHTTLYR